MLLNLCSYWLHEEKCLPCFHAVYKCTVFSPCIPVLNLALPYFASWILPPLYNLCQNSAIFTDMHLLKVYLPFAPLNFFDISSIFLSISPVFVYFFTFFIFSLLLSRFSCHLLPLFPLPSTSLLSPPHLSPSSLPTNPLRRSWAESLPLFHEFKCEKKQLELIQDEIGRDLAGEMVRMSRYLGFERWTGVDSPPNKSFFSREYFTASWPSRGTKWVIVIRINIRIFFFEVRKRGRIL